jgi:hypothetical protein
VQLAGLYLLGVVNPRAIGWIFNVQIQVREQETFEKLHEKCKLLNHTYSSTPPSAHICYYPRTTQPPVRKTQAAPLHD